MKQAFADVFLATLSHRAIFRGELGVHNKILIKLIQTLKVRFSLLKFFVKCALITMKSKYLGNVKCKQIKLCNQIKEEI